MAYKVGIANGNWSTAAVWDNVSNTPTSHASTNIALNATKYTAAFTAPVVDGVCAATGVALFGVTIPSTACTVTVTLQQNSAGWVDCAGPITASINMATVYAAIGATLNNWLYFRVPVPFIFLSATASYYRWAISYTGANTTTLMADAAGTAPAYWSTHIIAVPAIPANTDLVLIPGQNATSVIKVSVDGTRTIGNLTNTAACIAMRPATASLWWDMQIGYGGELNYDNAASAKLQCKGCVAVGTGGTYRQDDKSGGAYATGKIAKLAFIPTASGDCGLGIFDKSTVVLQGEPKTTIALYKTHPNVDWSAGWGVAANPAVVADVVGWAVNDEILIGPTEAYNQTEYKYIKTIGGGNSIVFSNTPGGAESGFTYAHTTNAWILNLTRNVVIGTEDGAGNNTPTLCCYIYGANTLTTGGIDIDWARFENLGSTTQNKYGVLIEAFATSFSNIDYSVAYNSLHSGFYYNATQTSGIYNGLIATKVTASGHGINLATVSNKIFNDPVTINNLLSGINTSNVGNILINDPIAIANGTGGSASYGGITIQVGSIIVNDPDIHLNRLYGVVFTSIVADVLFNNAVMGTKGANGTADIRITSGAYLSNVVFANPTLTTPVPSNYTLALIGSQLNIDKLGSIDMKHYFYSATGVGQSTGAGLADTKVRTVGSYGLLMSPDATTGTSGMKKTFYVLARPSSQVVVYGYLWRNAPACTINLYLPGSITPDATQTFGAAVDTSWQGWIVSGNYTGTLPKLAKVEIIVTGTSGGVYFDDIYNGTNLLGALDVWNNGDIAPIIYDQLGDAGAVWAYILSNALSGDANLTGLKTTLGVAGAGLTALGDTRIANLDATVSSRSTATQGATKAELDAAQAVIEAAMPSVSGLALEDGGRLQAIDTRLPLVPAAQGDIPDISGLAIEDNIQGHAADALNSYDPPTRAEATADKDEIIAAIPGAVDLTALTTLVTRTLGLAGENMVMDQTIFDADKKLTSARVRIYDSAAHALAAGDTGLIATFPLTMTWATKLLETMTQVIS